MQIILHILTLTCYNYIISNQPQQINMKRAIVLFDIDGTLTKPRNKIQQPMVDCLRKLSKKIEIAVVGGSDVKKIESQLNEEVMGLCKYVFSQNGLLSFEKNKVIGQQQIKDFLGQTKLQKFINFCLKYMSNLEIPVKRGTFIQYRTGLINVSPIGRNCSQEQRDDFQQYDKQHQIRAKFIQRLRQEFPDLGLNYSIGGQISFDVVPFGWDKTYCLRFLKQYDEIYFFGDKTEKGGNDYEIYEKMKIQNRGYAIKKGPQQTISILQQLFLK